MTFEVSWSSQTSCPEVMDLIEVPLNSYRYHFRRLVWSEELRLPFVPTEDQRKTVLSQALTDISGLKVTVSEALEILNKLPDAIFWRIWILYRANLPEERYYTAGGLYEAPDQMAYQKRIQQDDDTVETVADEATTLVQRRFGGAGVEDAENISRQMFRNAQQEGKLISARSESRHG
jgi:hypothetical protein